MSRKKSRSRIVTASLAVALVLLFFFLFFSYLHAYAFTHPTESKNLEINRDGMKLTTLDLIKATLMGIRPIRHNPERTPKDYDLIYENVNFYSSDELSIKGWWIPSSKQKATIIFAHGYNGNRGNLEITTFLNKAGYNVLMFDFRGHGGSDGNYISMGHYEKRDIEGAINYLSQRNDVDMARIYGLGQSMGAAALLFTQEEHASFKGLILESTYPSLYENVAARFKEVYGFPKFPFATSLTFFGGLILGVDGFSISPQNSIKNIRVPILLIHDELDTSVSIENTRALYDNANSPKELWVAKDAKHTAAYNAGTEEYKEKVLHFLNES